MPRNIITEAFDQVEAPWPGTPIGYFLCFGCYPPQYIDLIPKFLTNVRKHFKGFSEKDFIAPRNQQTNPKLTKDVIKQLHHLKVSWHFCESSDDAFLETQIHNFCQKYEGSHIVLISCNKSFFQRILNDEQLGKHPKYLIHNLELKVQDSTLVEKATGTISMDHFLDSLPDTLTALNNQFDSVKATQKGTPLIFLIDIENIPKPNLLVQVIDQVLEHFRGFDVLMYIGALTKESYDKLKEVCTELQKFGLELNSVEMEKNSADNYLIEKAMALSRDFPNACFVIMTSDCDFCRCVIKLRYCYNHDVYSIHKVASENSFAYTCMLPQATKAIPITYFWKKITRNDQNTPTNTDSALSTNSDQDISAETDGNSGASSQTSRAFMEENEADGSLENGL